MPKGLKIKNKCRTTLFDASQTAGVDYSDETENIGSDSSKEESKNEDSNLNLKNSNNFNENLSENIE